MARQHVREARAGKPRSAVKVRVGALLARIRVALRGALDAFRRSGPPPAANIAPQPQFPSLAYAEREYQALQELALRTATKAFPARHPDRKPGVMLVRRPSRNRLHVGH